MAWITPKTDWATDNLIGTADLNRIEGNNKHLLKVMGSQLLAGFGAEIAVPNATQPTDYSITITNQWHKLKVNTAPATHVYGTIKYIRNYTGLIAGHRIGFIKSNTTNNTVRFLAGTTLAGASPIHIVQDMDANELIIMIYTGSYWVTQRKP